MKKNIQYNIDNYQDEICNEDVSPQLCKSVDENAPKFRVRYRPDDWNSWKFWKVFSTFFPIYSESGNANASSIIIPRCSSSDVLDLSSDKSLELCSEGRILKGVPDGSGTCRGRSSSSTTSSSSSPGVSRSSTCGG